MQTFPVDFSSELALVPGYIWQELGLFTFKLVSINILAVNL